MTPGIYVYPDHKSNQRIDLPGARVALPNINGMDGLSCRAATRKYEVLSYLSNCTWNRSLGTHQMLLKMLLKMLLPMLLERWRRYCSTCGCGGMHHVLTCGRRCHQPNAA